MALIEAKKEFRVKYEIPFFTQRINLSDPNLEGFRSVEDAQYWQERGCGIACLRMIVEGLNGKSGSHTYGSLVYEGLHQKAFCERGWIHVGLVNLAKSFSVSGRAFRRQSVGDLFEAVTEGSPCIASVSVCFRGGQIGKQGTVIKAGGHLVVVLGAKSEGGKVTGFVVHHPSSNQDYDWENHFVPIERFEPSFSGGFMAFSVAD